MRRFGLFVAFVTLVGALGGLAWAVYSYSSPVSENIAKPKVDYKDFKQRPTTRVDQPRSSEEPPSATDGEGARRKNSEHDRQFEAHLQQIVANGNKFLAPELTIREEGVRSECKGLISDLPDDSQPQLGEAFMAQFETATVNFVRDQSNYANMNDPSSDKGERWTKFSRWMFADFRSQIDEEKQRIAKEKFAAEIRKTQAKVVATAAGASFVIFMLFTLMLVLLAIERNTRQQPVPVSEERTTPVLSIA